MTPATLGTALTTCTTALGAQFDATGLRVAGQRQWLHMACTPTTRHYGVHANRRRAATDEIGRLPAFHGIAMHDAWAA